MENRIRRLKDTVTDPKITPLPTKKAARKNIKKKNTGMLKIALALVIGFAGGFSTAKFFRF